MINPLKTEMQGGLVRHWFPLSLVALFLLLVGIGVHGSSVGSWSVFLGDMEYPHIGRSPAVRADDWVVSQPYIVGQCASDEYFPRVNRKINGGTDMFIQTPCGPVWDWTAIGQAHNWGFFIFGAERGTAWSWWLRFLGLPFFAYFFFLIWCRDDRLLAIGGAIAVTCCAPVQWWDTTLPYHMLYFFAVLVMAAAIKRSGSVIGIVVSGIGLLVSGLSYVFSMYPPFEIVLLPALVALLMFALKQKGDSKNAYLRACVFAGVVIAMGAEFFYFYHCHQPIFALIATSSYPGDRVFGGGTWNLLCGHALKDLASLFAWYHDSNAPGTNECEQARCLSLFWPAVVGAGMIYRRHGKLDGYVFALLAIAGVYLLRICFPIPMTILKYSGFARLGPCHVMPVEGIIVLIAALRIISGMPTADLRGRRLWVVPALLFAACLLPRIIALTGDREFAAIFFHSKAAIARFLFALFLSASIWVLLLIGRKKACLLLIMAWSLIGAIAVHPLVIGLDPLVNSSLARMVKEMESESPGKWWSNVPLGQIPLALGYDCISGIQQYCDRAYWNVVDPEQRHESVWNRYASRVAVGINEDSVCEIRDGNVAAVYHTISERNLKDLGVRYVIWCGAPLESHRLIERKRLNEYVRIYEICGD